MAKGKGSLFSTSAHGQFGKSLIFQTDKGRQKIKRYRKPTQPNSAAQLDKRSILQRAVTRWQGLSDEIKSLWQVYNTKTGKVRSGYNYFLSEYIHWTCQGYTPADDPRLPPTPPGPPPPSYVTDHLVSYWKMDTLVSNVVADFQETNEGTNHGAALVGGKINNCLQFVRTDSDYVDVGNLGNFGSEMSVNKPSFECWIKSSNTTDRMHIMGLCNAPKATVMIRINANSYGDTHAGNIFWDLMDEDENILRCGINSNTGITDGDWHHLVCTWDTPNNIVLFYLDSVLQTSVYIWQQTPVNTINFPYPFYLGNECHFGGTLMPFDGLLDEVRLYNKILSQDEVTQNFNVS